MSDWFGAGTVAELAAAARRKTSDVHRRIRALLTFHGAYRRLFLDPATGEISDAGKAVLADLAAFCHADQSTFYPDQRQSDRMAARREVFLHVAGALHFDHAKLEALRRELRKEEEDE
jgi:hypothetical protein